MKNRLLLNGLLILILASLASLIWLKPGVEKEKTQRISTLKEDDIHKITLQRADKQDILLEKKGGQWLVTNPYSTNASHIKVKLLLTLLSDEIKSEYSAKGKDLSQFELEPEKISIQFNDDNKIIFGITHPINYNRYILKEDKILLISESVYGALNANIASFFSTKLIPKGVQINKVALPKGYKLTDDTITNWQNANAVETFIWNKEKQPSQGTIILGVPNGKPIHYEIVETLPEFMLGNVALKTKYQIPEENLIGMGLVVSTHQ